MKAIRVEQFGEPEVLRLREVPDLVPGDDDVLVRIHAAGVNPVETYIRSGAYARKAPLPYTPGSDGSGVVAAVGKGVASVREGDRVFVSGARTGTYAEFALCAAEDVHPLPAAATFAQGAAIGIPYATAYRALFQRGAVQPGETVLVHGASGGVGTAAIQLATDSGFRVFGTAGTAAGLDLVRRLGADEVFDHRDPRHTDAILDATAQRGVDCILEMLANVNLAADLGLLALHGRVVVVGSRGAIEIDPREVMSRDADIRGMVLFNASPSEREAIYGDLAARLGTGRITPVVEREFPLDSAPEAHRAVIAHDAHGKIVLVP